MEVVLLLLAYRRHCYTVKKIIMLADERHVFHFETVTQIEISSD